MPALETITAIAVAVGKIFGFGEKAIKPDEIRIDENERKKARKEGDELIRIYDKLYARLKNHDEIDIATDVNLIYDNMDEEQRKELIENTTNRIFKYRSKPINRILFRKFLKTKEYMEWLEKQNNK